ncbi:hypothetical protein BC629DRAFT_1593532 [Irpex lacteus]|nr:hypothetical protein BC629DRAFT_1593532 [Irpex lacteus]
MHPLRKESGREDVARRNSFGRFEDPGEDLAGADWAEEGLGTCYGGTLYISEVVLGTAFGVLMGPHRANPRSWGHRTQEITRIVLATGLFTASVVSGGPCEGAACYGCAYYGVWMGRRSSADLRPLRTNELHISSRSHSLPNPNRPNYIVDTYLSLSPLTLPSPLPLPHSPSHSPSPTPTPTLTLLPHSHSRSRSSSLIPTLNTGGRAIKHFPTNLRRILAAESAAAYLYLTVETSRRVVPRRLAMYVSSFPPLICSRASDNGGSVLDEVVIGTFLGIAFSKLMRISYRLGRGYIDRESYVAQYLALALFTIAVASWLGTDDLSAAFAAERLLQHPNRKLRHRPPPQPRLLRIHRPFPSFNSPELGITYRAVLCDFVGEAMLVLYQWIPEISGWREALFSGHFGPMGVGAVFVSTLALSRLPEPHSPPQNQQEYLAATLQTIVAFIVLGSILIHGLSIPFFSFGRRIHSHSLPLTRTRTSRNNTMGNTLPEGVSGPDVEAARTGKPEPNVRMAEDADVLVVSQGVEEAQEDRIPHFGEASFLEEPVSSRSRESSLRRRTTGIEVPVPGSPSGLAANETGAASANADRPQIMLDTVDGESLPIAFKTRVESVDDNDDDKPPSGVQTPVKAVHFPPSQ